jgi:hypothetical protein
VPASIELAGENLGQPGFRELVLAEHDLTAGDLLFALVSSLPRSARRDADARRPEVFDCRE